MHPGYNLIADQLLQSPMNSLNVFLSSTTPHGAVFTKWDGSSFLPPSTYNAPSHTWSIDYTLNLGEGGVLWTPGYFTNTFVGEVGPYIPESGNQPWTPNYPTGMHLVSDPIPRAGNLSVMFANVVGRPPAAGESVWIFNEVTQLYNQSYFDGLAWDFDAALMVGQSAWFDIGGTGQMPPAVPEPSMMALLALVALPLLRRLRSWH